MSFRYIEVADELKAQIENLGLNSLLPSEEELARSFNVSRVTIRRALEVLEGAGLVDRQRGRGTIVNPLKVERCLMPMLPIERDLARQGLSMETELISVERRVHPPESIASTMRLKSSEAVSVITLLRRVQNRVVAFDRRYVPDSIVDKIDLSNINAAPIGELLARATKSSVTGHGMQLEFVPSSVEEANILNVTPGTLVVLSIGTDYFENGKPYTVTAMFYRIDRVKFSYKSDYSPLSNSED